MAEDRPPRRRRAARRFRPAHDILENRRLLSLNVTMIGQAQVMEGVATAPLSLASFSFSTTGSVTDYTASISWGDGTSSAGQIDEGATGMGTVVGSHTYTTFGTETVGVTVTGDGNTGSGSTSIHIVDAPLSAWAVSFAPSAGQSYSGTVADFSDVNASAPMSEFSASITWGNGNTTSGTITSVGAGEYAVSGTETYTSQGSYDLQVQVSDNAGQSAKGASPSTPRAPVPAVDRGRAMGRGQAVDPGPVAARKRP